MIARLRDLPFPAFLQIVAELMSRLGYSEVSVLRQRRDRNSQGGVDFAASASAGLAAVGVIAQAKQYSEPVQKRYVDGVRGAAVAEGAHHALIFSTSEFYDTAKAASSKGATTPVVLVGGMDLASLLARHGLGVTESGKATAIDPAFFDELAKRHGKEENTGDSHESGAAAPSLTLNVWFGERTSSSGSHRFGS